MEERLSASGEGERMRAVIDRQFGPGSVLEILESLRAGRHPLAQLETRAA